MDSVLIAPMAAESAVLVPVPEAERAVGGHRDRLDRAAAWGVPAHVTVPYPFVAPPAITATVIAGLADAVGTATAAARRRDTRPRGRWMLKRSGPGRARGAEHNIHGFAAQVASDRSDLVFPRTRQASDATTAR
jgi:hypothetical protein